MRCGHVAFLWRTYPTYRQYSGACVVHTLIVSSGAGGPTVAIERGVGAKIRLKVFYITPPDSSYSKDVWCKSHFPYQHMITFKGVILFHGLTGGLLVLKN